MSTRRIVMGHDLEGRSVVLDNTHVEPHTVSLLPGVEIHRLWELDDPPAVPVHEVQPLADGQFYPRPGGVRFGLITIPPGFTYELPAEADPEAALAEMEAAFPGMPAAFDPESPGIHATDTVDFIMALSGRGEMRTDDGVRIPISAGDCLIQNGTAHGWFNDDPSEPFVIAYVLCGATTTS